MLKSCSAPTSKNSYYNDHSGVPVVITGRLNMTTDTLSRQLNPHQHKWLLCPNIFNGILHHTQTYPNIDLFASLSWRPDPEACAVNAFVLR